MCCLVIPASARLAMKILPQLQPETNPHLLAAGTLIHIASYQEGLPSALMRCMMYQCNLAPPVQLALVEACHCEIGDEPAVLIL
jgi:hypothetical protein